MKNYSVFYPDLAGSKYRLLVVFKLSLVLLCNPTVLLKSSMDLWLKLSFCTGPFVIGSVQAVGG